MFLVGVSIGLDIWTHVILSIVAENTFINLAKTTKVCGVRQPPVVVDYYSFVSHLLEGRRSVIPTRGFAR
jgi:hypothetical protein